MLAGCVSLRDNTKPTAKIPERQETISGGPISVSQPIKLRRYPHFGPKMIPAIVLEDIYQGLGGRA